MLFVYPALAWAFALVSLPVLIHLINMMRHRRVKWAAMDFLLQSHKRMKHWVMLRQLLLLLTRMAAIALIVAMLAGLITTQSWSNMIGDRVTHHLILLDDTFSMRERLGGNTAFESAVKTTNRIIENLANQDRPQRISVVFYSDILRGDADATAPNLEARMRVDMDSSSITKLQELLANTAPTEQTIPLAEVLQRGSEIVTEFDQSEVAQVYIVSDFREKDWGSEATLRDPLSRIEQSSIELNWINCARLPQDNLAITDVTIGNGTVVAGIPTIVKVSVRNFGQQTAVDVPVNIELFGSTTGMTDISRAGSDLERLYDQLPITFDEIPPGDQVTRQTQIIFPAEGSHALSFRLPEDPLPLDNLHFATTQVESTIPVLIVDGDPKLTNAFYLQSVFNPGPNVSTGISPTTSSSSFLTTAEVKDLTKFETVFIIDPPMLDERIITTLKQYVETGGAIVWYCGPGSNELGLAELAKANLLPTTLQGPVELSQNTPDGPPDFDPGDNPIFKVFAGEKNPFLRRLVIGSYFPVVPEFAAEKPENVRVLGSVRTGDPLVLEHGLGRGKVITFLTSLGPQWNSWATNPSFIVAVLELRNYASITTGSDSTFPVGSPIAVTAPTSDYRGDVVFYSPGATRLPTDRSERLQMEPVAGTLDGSAELTGVDSVTGRFLTGQSGVYEAWLTKIDGTNEVRRYSLAPEMTESDLLGMNETNLRQLYPSVTFNYFAADAWQYDNAAQQGTNWQTILLCLVIGALLLEQVLAFYASYHPAAPGASAA
ncbi:BatA and WFA domain-containing protein [Bremerella sp. JC770]|uniref:BatA and WFA domain-containing protein n=1 Tax=Bremerella sp. JC770 TaxID=3232137 RepID=UPI003458AD55